MADRDVVFRPAVPEPSDRPAPGTPEAIREIAELIAGQAITEADGDFTLVDGRVFVWDTERDSHVPFDPYVNPAHTSMVIEAMTKQGAVWDIGINSTLAWCRIWGPETGKMYEVSGIGNWMTAVCDSARRTKE